MREKEIEKIRISNSTHSKIQFMTSDGCHSRHFSWLTRPCRPDPRHHHLSPQLRPISAVSTTISSLPDDLLLEILSRIPTSSFPSLYLICRRWSHLLDSPAFLHLRRLYGRLRFSLFVFSFSSGGAVFSASHQLGHDVSWKISNSFCRDDVVVDSHPRLVGIGRIVYLIGKSAVLRFDTWTNSVASMHEMLFARKKFAAAVVSGKIYVAGGSSRSSTVEEFNPDTNEWRVVSHAPRMRYGCIGAALDDVFYVIGGLKIHNTNTPSSGNQVVPRAAAHLYASSMDLYDVKANAWLRSRTVPGGGCVVAACVSGNYLFMLTSHAVELSFWRFAGNIRSRNTGGGSEWCRMKSPPIPAQVRLDGRVRFSCVGAGDGKVVLIQVVGCVDDLLRRSGRSCRGLKDGLVLVYDSTAKEWSRGLDLPEFVQRAAGVCVEC